MNFKPNPILSTDSYKLSHWLQYPPGTTGLFSYIEARSQKPGHDRAVFFGLQPFLESLAPISRLDIEQAAMFASLHGEPFNREGWEHILREHCGHLPVSIKAVPEGTVVPNGNALVTVESTDPQVPWVASHMETALLRAVWYPTTVATRSYEAKRVILEALHRTGTPEQIGFKLHDFGARGVSSQESAILGGMAHLVNFLGTDTMEAVQAMQHFYRGSAMPGCSIPAAEHSTITSWGREGELDAYTNMLDQYAKPGAVLAVVSDSYNIFDACRSLWGGALRERVINSGATLVIRPDSGDPTSTLLECLSILAERFGTTTNAKGFRVLNHVRLIQGDGLDGPHTIRGILAAMELSGWSADNVAFGMGGGLLQQVNRDTLGFAMKCSAIQIGNQGWREVYKDPIAGGKTSKRGRITLAIKPDGEFATVPLYATWAGDTVEALQEVWRNGRRTSPDLGIDQLRQNTGLW